MKKFAIQVKENKGAFAMFFLDTRPEPRYKKQLRNVEHLVLHDVKLSKERLEEILEILYEYRVID